MLQLTSAYKRATRKGGATLSDTEENLSGSQETTQFDRPPETPAKPPGEAPDRIGHYRLERRLGRGGMGEVFLAWDERLKRWVALKHIRPDSDQRQDQLDRFLLEASSAGQLSHSAIVQIHDLVPDPPGHAIVMEYVEGETLCDRIAAAGPLPVREALRLAREIAEGLAAAHSKGFIHRDLKTENVIVTPQGQPKILDFGLVKPIETAAEDPALTRKGVIVGTFRSMSPEQACCEPLDERSDLFSLGVLLYEMLSGRTPFRGKKDSDTVRRVIADHPPALSAVRDSIPQGVSDLVDRLLAKSRDDHPPNARVVIRRLQDLEASLPASSSDSVSEMMTAEWSTTARPDERQSRPLTSTGGMSVNRRRRHVVAVGAVALLAVLLGVAMFIVRRPPVRPIRVMVMELEVPAGTQDPRLELTAQGVRAAANATLASLEGVSAIEPLRQSQKTPEEIANSGGADEIITGRVDPNGEQGRVTLTRVQVRGKGKQTIDKTLPFDVRMGSADLPLLIKAVAKYTRKIYPDHAPRPGATDLGASDSDYAQYLAVKRDRDRGDINLTDDLIRLDGVLRSSPNFLEAKILAAKISLYLFQIQHDQHFAEKAREIVRSAEKLAPEEPRVLILVFQCDLEEGKIEEAEGTLQQLDQLLPGDPDIAALHAELAEKKGQTEEAIAALRTAVLLAPTWQNLYTLADLEAQTGQIREARQHFELILDQSHDNVWALDGLARIELFYGDLDRARKSYEDVARTSPQSRSFVNLGLVNFLLHNYQPAMAAFHQALSIEPNSTVSLLDLADTELEMGQQDKASAHYQQALKSLDESPKGTLTPAKLMIKAQCLAHSRNTQEAVQIVQKTLSQNPNNSQFLLDAALVYCLTNQRDLAISYTKAALEKQVQPTWFYAYGCFRSIPEISLLLEAARELPPSH
ncbi:MAG TPA: protein kinase [Thermoanaerobaculia bacterium]|jgi:serine/threonine-protein kinase|nr:protein kinase [Thermoanaerobaculia bacterium]